MSDDPSTEPMRIDTALIRQLADLLAENELSEIEVEDGDRKIVVKRKLSAAAPAAYPPPVAQAASPAPGPVEPLATLADAVKSPMVGTVFLSAEPGAPPFIAVGATVEAGDTLLIIEAMKVMNPIAAPKAGVVRQICVADAQPVEYDQPLVVID